MSIKLEYYLTRLFLIKLLMLIENIFLCHIQSSENKLCTTTSIIQVSYQPFATGLRKVNKLIKEKN